MASGYSYATGGVWYGWTSSTSSTTDTTWITWTNATSTASSTTTSASSVWYDWNNGEPVVYTYQPRELTEEEKERQRVAQEKSKQEAAERQRKLEEARQKAEELLLSQLSPGQKNQYRKRGWFVCRGQSGKSYRIRKGWSGNVDELNKQGKPVSHYCIHSKEAVPTEDNMLIQKFMLELDEARFLQIANKSRVYA